MRRTIPFASALMLATAPLSFGAGCGGGSDESGDETASSAEGTPESTGTSAETPSGETERAAPSPTGAPDSLETGLLLSLARLEGRQTQPARLIRVFRRGGEWQHDTLDDAGSNVFHKAMVITPEGQDPAILTLGGMAAAVKLWRPDATGALTSETLWEEAFGGRFNRMRDAEIGDVDGDGNVDIAVGTHDQGVVAVIHPEATGDARVQRLDRRENIFVHEIELGDLNGDGKVEIYATPSEPNRIGVDSQHGEVVRYTPSANEGRTLVADLGNRHAKEIYVGDVDGDGRDELYVVVEAKTTGRGASLVIEEPVEIRRYDADTAPDARVVVATLDDRLCRFITVGDIDGDGKREMVAAGYSSGLWLLRPGANPREAWAATQIDRNSGGFEHASLLTDLDGDGRDELYVASDRDHEVRRYVFRDGSWAHETILEYPENEGTFTWNIMPAPAAMLPR